MDPLDPLEHITKNSLLEKIVFFKFLGFFALDKAIAVAVCNFNDGPTNI